MATTCQLAATMVSDFAPFDRDAHRLCNYNFFTTYAGHYSSFPNVVRLRGALLSMGAAFVLFCCT
jgi:hypothetical protein